MTSLISRFAKTVRRLRLAAGFSQEGFAAKVGIDRGYYGKIERGEVNITLEKVEKIASGLGTTPGALITETDREAK